MKIHLSRRCNFSAKKLVIFGRNKPKHPVNFKRTNFARFVRLVLSKFNRHRNRKMLEVKNKNSLEAKMKFPKIIMKDLFSHLCLKLLLVEIRDEYCRFAQSSIHGNKKETIRKTVTETLLI